LDPTNVNSHWILTVTQAGILYKDWCNVWFIFICVWWSLRSNEVGL